MIHVVPSVMSALHTVVQANTREALALLRVGRSPRAMGEAPTVPRQPL